MKKLFLIPFLLATISLCAQQKYAILINRYEPLATVDSSSTWQSGKSDFIPKYEFWCDLFLMWEMLHDRGFEDENIFVFYDHGIDYKPLWINQRYKAESHLIDKITDYRAYRSTVDSVFEGLATGYFGLPELTEDDFLVLYFFGHGKANNSYSLFPIEPEPGGAIYWSDLSEKLDSIKCFKKIVIMQQCYSGSSIPFLEDTNTIVLTATAHDLKATAVDGLYYDSISYPGDSTPGNSYYAYEFEQYPGDTTHYPHGEFDFHFFNAIKRIDPANQSVIYQTDYQNFPLADADSNCDNYTSISEAYDWIIKHDSRMMDLTLVGLEDYDDPKLSDLSNISAFTSIEYPTLIFNNIDSNELHRGLIGVTKTIHVTSGNQLTFKSNAVIDIVNNSKIIVDNGGSLIIEDNVTINGFQNQVLVNGTIQIGSNVTFNNTIVEINNYNLQSIFDTVLFSHSQLVNYGSSLNVSNSAFSDSSRISSYLGDVTVTNTTFSDSWVYLENQEYETNFVATISNCSFNSGFAVGAIDIWNYNKFMISNNTITGYYNGIQLMQSGGGPSGNQTILENEITNSTSAGILSFNSTSSIAGNYIYDNYCGIRLYNNSNTDIIGNPGATADSLTQQILDNDSYELYFAPASFPWYIRHNVIIDEDNAGNPTDPMVYHSGTGGSLIRDVRYNCWGYSFNAQADLYPSGYMVDPIRCPGGGYSTQEAAETLYLSGKALYDSADYTNAKTTFEMVINQYPETEYASASMKDLFTIEEYTSHDYGTLQQYYNTNSAIQNDSVLAELSYFLANKCDVKMENWQPAISHYEDIINNPQTTEDSIFAIIDLGHTYYLMANSGNNRSMVKGILIEHIPDSKERFFAKRDYLLSLLPINRNKEYLYQESEGNKLLNNVPNPTNNRTTIYYQLTTESIGNIQIINTEGKIIKEIRFQNEPGLHHVVVDMSNYPSGIYYYTMSINGTNTDIKKMILIKQ